MRVGGRVIHFHVNSKPLLHTLHFSIYSLGTPKLNPAVLNQHFVNLFGMALNVTDINLSVGHALQL